MQRSRNPSHFISRFLEKHVAVLEEWPWSVFSVIFGIQSGKLFPEVDSLLTVFHAPIATTLEGPYV